MLDVQITCGGRIGVFVRAIADLPAYAEQLSAKRDSRESIDVVIDLESGQHHFETAVADCVSVSPPTSSASNRPCGLLAR